MKKKVKEALVNSELVKREPIEEVWSGRHAIDVIVDKNTNTYSLVVIEYLDNKARVVSKIKLADNHITSLRKVQQIIRDKIVEQKDIDKIFLE